MFISILHTYVMPSRLKIISQSTYQVNSKNNGLKPGPPRNIFYITNFTSKLLNCYVLKTLCSKAKQSRSLHCCIKCPQNLQVKTLLQTYTAFTCRIYNEIFLKVFYPRNRGNLLLKLQFFVLYLDFFL